jgi:glycine cleavage system H protein
MLMVAGYELDPARAYERATNLWVSELGAGRVRVGFDPLGAETTGDIVAVSFAACGARLAAGETLAIVEAAKFVGPIAAPVGGVLADVNGDALAAPGTINADPLGTWLAELHDVPLEDLVPLVRGADQIAPWFEAAVDRFRSQGAIAE